MVLKKKGDEQITALQQTTFRRENLSLVKAIPKVVTIKNRDLIAKLDG
jgi:hypothetical protein